MEQLTANRFTVDSDGKYWDRLSNKYVTIDHLFYLVEKLEKENEQLKQQWKEKRHEDINELSVIAMRYKALENENEQLKEELKVYRKVANCGNCHHHNYDWFDDGDEFEVCDKGNDVTKGICEEWVEL